VTVTLAIATNIVAVGVGSVLIAALIVFRRPRDGEAVAPIGRH